MNGEEVRILTARVAPEYIDRGIQTVMIQDWCRKHIGAVLPVQAHKCGSMRELWDDRAVSVIPNMGVPVEELDYVLGIESDAYVSFDLKKDPKELTVHMVTGNPLDDYTMTPREAMVLAARLIRAAQELEDVI